MLDLLTPSELTLNLTRVYVYNMNSAFRFAISQISNVAIVTDAVRAGDAFGTFCGFLQGATAVLSIRETWITT